MEKSLLVLQFWFTTFIRREVITGKKKTHLIKNHYVSLIWKSNVYYITLSFFRPWTVMYVGTESFLFLLKDKTERVEEMSEMIRVIISSNKALSQNMTFGYPKVHVTKIQCTRVVKHWCYLSNKANCKVYQSTQRFKQNYI